jgi:hypothetical protein
MPLDHILNKMNVVHILKANFFHISCNIMLTCTPRFSDWFLPSIFTNLYLVCDYHNSVTRAAWFSALILLYLIIYIIPGEDYILWSSS